jgi:uncharacterized protein
MGRKYRVISGDGHLETPPDPWVKYVSEAHRPRAPRLVRLPTGGDAWIVEGQPMLRTGQNLTGGGPVRFDGGIYTDEQGQPVPGAGDAVQRLQEQDIDGIDAEVLFPPVFVTRFIEGIQDRDAYRAIVRAYNTFLAEEFCSVAPDRLIGVAFMPVSGIDDAIAELEWAASHGIRTVMIQQFPNGKGQSQPEDDRFWERSLELGIALSPHLGFGVTTPPMTGRHDTSLWPAPAGMAQHATGPVPGYTLAQLIVGGVFDRFPALRLYFAESNCTYLPGMLYYMDRDYQEYNDWFQVSLKMLPSQYIEQHALFGMIQERPAIKMAEAGLLSWDNLMWGSDFPHSVGTWPKSRQYLQSAFEGVPEEAQRQVVLDNPARYFGLDLDADITETPPASVTV